MILIESLINLINTEDITCSHRNLNKNLKDYVKIFKKFFLLFLLLWKNEEHDERLIERSIRKIKWKNVNFKQGYLLEFNFRNFRKTLLNFFPDLKSKLKTLENMTSCSSQKSGWWFYYAKKQIFLISWREDIIAFPLNVLDDFFLALTMFDVL